MAESGAALQPARVVLLLQDLRFGGTQRQTLELARGLDRQRFAPEIWCLCKGEDMAPLARRYGVPVVWLAATPAVTPLSLMNLWRRLRQTPVELLMLLTVIPNLWGRLVARLAKVPVIVANCRGGNAPRRQRERWLWPLADHLICNSQVLCDRLVQDCHVPAPRLSVIPNGVDTGYFSPAAPPKHPVILAVGRLVPDKDPETLVRAFHLLALEFPAAQLWLVGDGPRRAVLAQLAAAGPGAGRVRLLAATPEVPSLYAQATLLALSSIAEALPNVVLEAMAAGLPVVATAVGGVPELVRPGETGLLVPPGDPPALAAALRQMLRNPDWAQTLGRAGRQQAETRFSLAAMVARHAELFIRLLTRPGRPV